MIYQRLHATLESHQSRDQVGFRPKYSVEDAFIVLESMISKSYEWKFPIWMASLDLRKAFDRIEYHALFDALREQGVGDNYLALLASMYSDQTGCIRGSKKYFNIERGVKQGDIISPVLFNAALELVMRRWKIRINGSGINLGIGECLTNIRYADDLMLYASSLEDLTFMMQILFEELQKVGLQINGSKCKIATTDPENVL